MSTERQSADGAHVADASSTASVCDTPVSDVSASVTTGASEVGAHEAGASARDASASSGRRLLMSRDVTVMGIPARLILFTLLGAVLVGLLLSFALRASTLERVDLGAARLRDPEAPGKNASGQTVVTEATLGAEVQRLIEAGTLAPMANFDAATCLKGQGIDEPMLMMEEVSWGPNGTSGWLLIHGPVDRDTLRANGGSIGATVVTSTCAADPSQNPAASRLWAGTVMIGGL